MTPTDPGWLFFEESQAPTNAASDRDRAYAAALSGPAGKAVLDDLAHIVMRVAPLGAADEVLREHEGARRLAINIINSVKRGQQ